MAFDIQDMLRLPLLSSLEEETLKALHKSGRLPVTTHRRGQLLHVEGDTCDALEIVLSGQVKVERIGEDGDLMTIATFHKGDCIGGNLLFSSDPVYHMAVTVTEQAHILSLSRASLISLFTSNEEFLIRYLGYVADNAVTLEGKLKYYANLPIRQRVLNYLNAQQRQSGDNRVALPASKKALAAQLGVQRTSLSRVLQQMQKEGVLTFDKKSITLLNDFGDA